MGAGLLRQRESGIILAGIIIFVIFALASGGKFVTLGNWASIAGSAAELGIVTVGVAMLMVGGDFDLSVGSNFAFSAMVMAIMIQDGYPVLAGLVVAAAIGAGIGLLNAFVTIYFDIPSFVATLGTWLLWSGVTLIVAGGATITVFTKSTVLSVLGGPLTGQFSWEAVWWLFIALVVGVVLHRTVLGNWIFGVGGRKQAAYEAGVRVTRTRTINFMICGLLAALAGAVTLGHLNSMAESYGTFYQLYAIAAAVVGGCALYGGKGSIFGAVIGSVILSMLDSGLILSGVSTYWYQAVVGIIVVLAVAMHNRVGRLVRGGGE
ncbi:MAG: ABC transporter permease [Acidimicrobiales bacterium]